MNNLRYLSLGLIGCATALGMPMIAHASEQGDEQKEGGDQVDQLAPRGSVALDPIIVTAERRATNIQDTPLTISAITSQSLLNAGRQSLSDLAGLIPGVSHTGTGGANFIVMRGVGNVQGNFGIESPIATYVDGVYLFNSHAAMLSFNDLERIEVLKGPQGTLFGRNATGGVIHVITKDPQDYTFIKGDVGYGNYNTIEGRVHANTPLSDNVLVSFAAFGKERQDGFGINVTTGNETYTESRLALHGKILVRSDSDRTRVTISGLYDKSKLPGSTYGIIPGFRAQDFTTNIGYFNSASRVDGDTRADQTLFSLKVEQELDWANLMGLVSHAEFDETTFAGNYISGNNTNPVTGTLVPAVYLSLLQRSWTQTAELQLQSPSGQDFRWVLGAFFLQDISKTNQDLLRNDDVLGVLTSRLETRSISGFVQATKTILPKTELTLGFRYTSDWHGIEGQNSQAPMTPELGGIPTSIKESKPTYRVALSHHFNDNTMAYASFNTGFRSGRYVNNNFSNAPVFPETIDAYEVGLKTELFDRRLRLNISAYDFSYDNLQVRATDSSNVSRTINAAKAKGQGIDLDFSVLITDRLRLDGGVSYNKSSYTRFPGAPCPVYDPATGSVDRSVTCDLSGARLPRSPNWSGTVRASYSIPTEHGEFQLAVEDGYSGNYTFEPDGLLVQPAFHNVSSSIVWTAPSERFWVRLWMKNILNEKIFATQGIGSSAVFTAGSPRMYGAVLGFEF